MEKAATTAPTDEDLLRAATEILSNTTEYLPLNPISPDAVGRWLTIDDDQTLAIPLRRRDIDALYFSIQALSASTVNFQNAMQSWTQGKAAIADIYYEVSRRENTRVFENLARFMEAVMQRAVKYDPESQ